MPGTVLPETTPEVEIGDDSRIEKIPPYKYYHYGICCLCFDYRF
jgi:hypothetical protein